jgi:hypothetical protein
MASVPTTMNAWRTTINPGGLHCAGQARTFEGEPMLAGLAIDVGSVRMKGDHDTGRG